MTEAIADTLRKLAGEIENSGQQSVIGEQISVSVSGPGTGNVVGKSVSVSVGPGNHGNVVGSRVGVSVGPRDPKEVQLIHDLKQEAARVDAGDVDKTRIQSLLGLAGALTSAGITAVTRGVVSALLGN